MNDSVLPQFTLWVNVKTSKSFNKNANGCGFFSRRAKPIGITLPRMPLPLIPVESTASRAPEALSHAHAPLSECRVERPGRFLRQLLKRLPLLFLLIGPRIHAESGPEPRTTEFWISTTGSDRNAG